MTLGYFCGREGIRTPDPPDVKSGCAKPYLT